MILVQEKTYQMSNWSVLCNMQLDTVINFQDLLKN